MSDREGYLQRRDQLLMQDEEIAELKTERDKWKHKNSCAVGLLNKLGERCKRKEAELAALKEKARAAVNAPYEDILDMGLAQALRELGEVL